MGVLTVATVFISGYAMSPVVGAFYRSLIERDLTAFIANCKYTAVLYVLMSVLTSTAQFLSDVLAVRWRAQLTNFLHNRYLHPDHRSFCWIARADEKHAPQSNGRRDESALPSAASKACQEIVKHVSRPLSGAPLGTACGMLPVPQQTTADTTVHRTHTAHAAHKSDTSQQEHEQAHAGQTEADAAASDKADHRIAIDTKLLRTNTAHPAHKSDKSEPEHAQAHVDNADQHIATNACGPHRPHAQAHVDNADQRIASDSKLLCDTLYNSHAHAHAHAHAGPHVDNADQRIASDSKLLCDTLADTMQKILGAPLTILINGWLALRAVGWVAPLLISLYFVLCLATNHWLATRVSSAVSLHQRLEGTYADVC
jgi:hypothetical protein